MAADKALERANKMPKFPNWVGFIPLALVFLAAILYIANLYATSSATASSAPLTQPTPSTQTCGAGSNCFQGNNSGHVEMNQYGAPKLLMTDEQRAAIKTAMRPYKGSKFVLYSSYPTEDSEKFSKRLRDTLIDAGLICGQYISGDILMSEGTVHGLYVVFGKNKKDQFLTLESALIKSGALDQDKISFGKIYNEPDAFTIIISPNR